MSSTIAHRTAKSQRLLPEKSGGQLHADVRKPESEDAMAEIGGCLDFARRAVGWSLKELAAALHRDERQVKRWMDGAETTNLAAVFAVTLLRAPFVIALARLAGECEEETTLRFKRRA